MKLRSRLVVQVGDRLVTLNGDRIESVRRIGAEEQGVKRVVKPRCRFGCRFIQVSDNLWLCPHASYGAASYLKGAVEAAWAMVEKAGGYDTIVRRLEAEEGKRKQDREAALEQGRVNMANSVRYR